jgi:class 3 adenylate cyclase
MKIPAFAWAYTKFRKARAWIEATEAWRTMRSLSKATHDYATHVRATLAGRFAEKEEKPAAWSEPSDFRNEGVRLVRQETVVLLVDLVEAVRLMQEHEAYTVRRWAEFVHIVDAEILPRCGGLMVKSLGDGLLTRFETVPEAVNAAAEMHRTLAAQNAGFPEDQHFHLRAGVNAAMAWSNGIDYYGKGVNLAARLATLAGPGETIASASAHEQLAAALASLARPGETISSAAARDELTHGG